MSTRCRAAIVGATGIAGQQFNTRMGAAGGAVLVAEWLKAKGYIG